MATTKRGRARTSAEVERLYPETWGEKLNRAYRRQKAKHGQVYRNVAERISQVYPMSDATLIRLERNANPPTDPRSVVSAYMAIIAYGYDPADFDLDLGKVPTHIREDKRVADLLKPSSRCIPVSAA